MEPVDPKPRWRLGSGLRAVRSRVHRLPGGRLAWRLAATGIGVGVVVVGVILLPLPGPGWLIIFAGLGILATEYVWAHRLLGFARRWVTRWTQWTLRQPRWIVAGVITVILAAIAGFGFVGYQLWPGR
jgi:uncharacterized protein (TIGR02611 family)